MGVLWLVARYAREMIERDKGGIAFDLGGRGCKQVDVRERAAVWACAGTHAVTALMAVCAQT